MSYSLVSIILHFDNTDVLHVFSRYSYILRFEHMYFERFLIILKKQVRLVLIFFGVLNL